MTRPPLSLPSTLGAVLLAGVASLAPLAANGQQVDNKNCLALPCVAAVSTTASAQVNYLLGLTIDKTNVQLGSPTVLGAYQNATDANVVTVKANSNWTLSIRASSAAFSAPAGVTKNATDLEYAVSPGNTASYGAFAQITNSNVTISGSPETPTAQKDFGVRYRTMWNATDSPGSYSLSIIYTLAAQ